MLGRLGLEETAVLRKVPVPSVDREQDAWAS